jgi:hypothetical protein
VITFVAASSFTLWLIFASQGARPVLTSPLKDYPSLAAEADSLHRLQNGTHAPGEKGASSIYTCRPTGTDLQVERAR